MSLEYNHPGLSKIAYIIHPLRVARLLISFTNEPSPHEIMLSLVHNLKEVVGEDEFKKTSLLNRKLKLDVNLLTVDRKHQWDKRYKKEYYYNLKTSTSACLVKVFDKFDNIFLLTDNPSKKIKILYLNEIEEFIIPLTSKLLPSLYNHMVSTFKTVKKEVLE